MGAVQVTPKGMRAMGAVQVTPKGMRAMGAVQVTPKGMHAKCTVQLTPKGMHAMGAVQVNASRSGLKLSSVDWCLALVAGWAYRGPPWDFLLLFSLFHHCIYLIDSSLFDTV